MDQTKTRWYSKDSSEIAELLDVDIEQGLSTELANKRFEQNGPNKLKEIGGKSAFSIFIDQFLSTLILLLIVAAVISYFIGNIKDSAVILIIVTLNAALGFFQEYRAEKAVAALKQLEANFVQAIRDGKLINIAAELLVPGDIVQLEAGSRVPADLRLFKTVDLKINESTLTGESAPVSKKESIIEIGKDIAIADRRNMTFAGTNVTYGRGSGIVIATGMNTELGKIASIIQNIKADKTPLQKRISKLGRQLTILAILLVAVIFIAGVAHGLPARIMLLTAISLAVAAVPEGLPAVITIALSLGAQRMSVEKALIRKLPAVETLGVVTLICSDKTGTLTENKMTANLAYVNNTVYKIDKFSDTHFFKQENQEVNDEDINRLTSLLKSATLCNNAFIEKISEKEVNVIGDPTEGALLDAAMLIGIDKEQLEKEEQRVEEIPFTSERKRMSTINSINGEYYVHAKGAVDILLAVCEFVLEDGKPRPIGSKDKSRILRINDEWASRGIRILGVAYKKTEPSANLRDEKEMEKDLIFIGMIGMTDPPRKEVMDAMYVCKRAGIRPVMITGDHMLTAEAIGREIDLCAEDKCGVISGSELEDISLEELEKAIDDVSIYARVSPEHKLKLVQAYKDKGHIVAMTGDGVNDAPALKKADIGIAMGITGTDVSKEAADMILMDDNFATIVMAVKEGRVIYDNIRKFFRYMLSTNSGEILTMFFAILLGYPLPILPIQILWINLVTDGLPAVALGFEKAEKDTMAHPPRDPKESLFARGLGFHVMWVGLFIAFGTLYIFDGGAKQTSQTMAFMALSFFQMFHVMAIRTERESVLKSGGLTANKLLLGAVGLTFFLQILITYWQPLQKIFNTVSLSSSELLSCLIVSSLIFFAVDFEKRIIRNKTAANF